MYYSGIEKIATIQKRRKRVECRSSCISRTKIKMYFISSKDMKKFEKNIYIVFLYLNFSKISNLDKKSRYSDFYAKIIHML